MTFTHWEKTHWSLCRYHRRHNSNRGLCRRRCRRRCRRCCRRQCRLKFLSIVSFCEREKQCLWKLEHCWLAWMATTSKSGQTPELNESCLGQSRDPRARQSSSSSRATWFILMLMLMISEFSAKILLSLVFISRWSNQLGRSSIKSLTSGFHFN